MEGESERGLSWVLTGCAGRKLAVMEIKMVLVLLVLSFEFLPLPEELDSLAAVEKIFREPAFPYAKIRVL